jgi:hypothetical protein
MTKKYGHRMFESCGILKHVHHVKTYYLPRQALNDLKLWQRILSKANIRISLNLMTYRSPNKLYWSDACEYGIGGFSAHGKALLRQIPT